MITMDSVYAHYVRTYVDTKVILSLFDFSGHWPKYYKDNGYTVYCIDIKHGIDILEFFASDIPHDSVYGILAAPPCTDFSGSGAQYWKIKDADGRTDVSLALVDRVLDLVDHFNPKFWALENPAGRLSTLRSQLGKPWYFQPHEVAGWCETRELQAHERYTKKTGLWGKFNIPEKKDLGNDPSNNWIMKLGGKSERTKELRSMTPLGFARAFYESNK